MFNVLTFKYKQDSVILRRCKLYVQIYVWVSVHHTLIHIKKTNLMQSNGMFIDNCKIALHVSAAFCVHLQEH